jgi:oxygen-dependent protoporphyrinogen oxidase
MIKKEFAVLGGGITGLSLAWQLKKRFGDQASITLLEKGPRLGGWIQTVKKDNFLFERGPRGFRPQGEGYATLRLIRDLNLESLVIPASDSAKIRYLWHEGRLQALPSTFLSFLFSPLTRSTIFPCLRELFIPPQQIEDESITSFFTRRFNKYILETFADPMISGIYAGDVSKLSLKSCFPKLCNWEHRHRSILRGILFSKPADVPSDLFITNMTKKSLLSFSTGMETLVHALEKQLCNDHVQIKLSQDIESLSFSNDKAHFTIDGQNCSYDHVFSAIPAAALADLLPSPYIEGKNILNSIPTTSLAVINMGFKSKVLKKKGFGYLIPSKEKEKVLGMTWDSFTFPQHNHYSEETRITVMIGGSKMPGCDQKTESDLMDIATRALQHHLNITQAPDTTDIYIAKNAIPQYTVGHSARYQAIKNHLNDNSKLLSIAGSSFLGIGINSCIAAAEELVEQFQL